MESTKCRYMTWCYSKIFVFYKVPNPYFYGTQLKLGRGRKFANVAKSCANFIHLTFIHKIALNYYNLLPKTITTHNPMHLQISWAPLFAKNCKLTWEFPEHSSSAILPLKLSNLALIAYKTIIISSNHKLSLHKDGICNYKTGNSNMYLGNSVIRTSNPFYIRYSQ